MDDNLPCQRISGIARWCGNEDDLVGVDVTKSKVTKTGALIDLVDISVGCVVRHTDCFRGEVSPCWTFW